MKKALLILSLLCSYFMGMAQDNCSKFYPMEEGTTMQMTLYDKKNKPSGVIDYTVKEAGDDKATMAFEMHDEKGELLSSSEYHIVCKEDGVSIDFSSLMSPALMEQYKDVEVDMTGTELILPNNLGVGQTLPDADVLMNIKMTPINMKMTSKMFNRKVVSQESLTTPAGTFDCYVITFDSETKMGVKISSSGKLWLAEGVGMVKQETYNKKGDFAGATILTEFSK